MGSVDAELIIGDDQVSITDDGTLGEMAICATNDLLKAISKKGASKEKLYSIINDPHRLNKLLKEFYSMCPETGSSRTVSIGFCGETPTELSSNHKKTLHELMNKPAEEYEKEIFGWVFDLRVDQQKKIMIDTSEGQITCFYDNEIENEVREYIGKFVNVKGTMKPHNKYYAMYIDSEDSVEESTDYFLKQMRVEDDSKPLLENVPLLLEREDDCYVASNDELGILAVSNSMKNVIKEAEGQLFILFKEYVLTDDKLADSGQLLSDKLKFIAGGTSGYL
jgi:translation initiation factor 2 beta subunit (eIF-2beta)/eIF-5